eukprot:229897-Chlamydomonas_euryale.AAC.10
MAEGIKQRAGHCHKGHAIAYGPEPPHTPPPGNPTRGPGIEPLKPYPATLGRGLPTTPPSPTSPSANNS